MVNCVGIIHEGRMLEECSYQQLQENRYSYIRLVVKEPEQVYEYLKNDLSIGKIKKPEASVIKIYDLKYGTLELNSRLFAAGFSVVEISKCRNSLEDDSMSMNISGFGTSNASYTGMNTGNKRHKAAEEAVLADVMAEEAMMTPEQPFDPGILDSVTRESVESQLVKIGNTFVKKPSSGSTLDIQINLYTIFRRGA